MAARINPTLFDKLVADLDVDGLRDDPKIDPGPAASGATTARLYPILKLERFNEAALRATVLRELNWILNTTNLGSITDLKPYPEVATSVLNYGVPDMAGKLLQRRAIQTRAREIKEAIRRFEPRIAPQRLDVTATATDAKPNAVTFVIRADVTSAVMALPVEFKTDVEIDTGAATLRE
jgi:type VI secretion system protein ImpF